MKVNEVVYYCLDAIKAFSDDSYVNEEHVLYLINKYRASLLQHYYNTNKPITESNYQIIELNLDRVFSTYTTKTCLKSIETIPTVMAIKKPTVLLFNGLETENIEKQMEQNILLTEEKQKPNLGENIGIDTI